VTLRIRSTLIRTNSRPSRQRNATSTAPSDAPVKHTGNKNHTSGSSSPSFDDISEFSIQAQPRNEDRNSKVVKPGGSVLFQQLLSAYERSGLAKQPSGSKDVKAEDSILTSPPSSPQPSDPPAARKSSRSKVRAPPLPPLPKVPVPSKPAGKKKKRELIPIKKYIADIIAQGPEIRARNRKYPFMEQHCVWYYPLDLNFASEKTEKAMYKACPQR
jgi:hypothetical protein